MGNELYKGSAVISVIHDCRAEERVNNAHIIYSTVESWSRQQPAHPLQFLCMFLTGFMQISGLSLVPVGGHLPHLPPPCGDANDWTCGCTYKSKSSGVVRRMDPLHFLARCHKRWLNQALSVSLTIDFLCVSFVLIIRAIVCVLVVCISVCSVSDSWLFWLSCQYLPSDRLERLLWGRLYAIRR